jgi:hypothetical protein
MAIYIEQNPDEVRHSFNVQRRAEIISAFLTAASLDCHPQFRDFGQDLSMSVRHQSKGKVTEDGMLLTTIDFALEALPEHNDSVRAFTVKCRFLITYLLEKEYQPTPQEIKSFAGANAVFNAWPYFREFVQSACSRMGIPASPAVPFLKLVPKLDQTKAAAEPPKADATSPSPPKARKHPRKSA